MRRISCVVAAIGAIACGFASAAQARAVMPTASRPAPGVHRLMDGITWGPCDEQDLIQLGAQCGHVSVPVNYAHPDGAHIKIAVSRLKHTSSAADYKGVILSNPGGPGGAGLDLSPILAYVLNSENYTAAAADYDWIGFDPRGVGESDAISCDPNFEGPDRRSYNPHTRSLLKYWTSRSNAYASKCVTKSAQQTALLDNDTTVDSARDMNSIREALGRYRISYYGFSYGTYLGQVFSTLFPNHVKRLIMDSNVDPRGVFYQDNLDQDAAFQRNIGIWFSWLARYHAVYHLGTTADAVAQRFYATRRALRKAPAGGQVGPDEWTDIFLQAGYYQLTWLNLGHLFSEWVHSPGAQATSDLVSAYQSTDTPGDDNELADYLAVQCTDAQWPQSLNRVLADNRHYNTFAPFETWANGWFNGPCNFWRPPASQPVQINGDKISSALLIDETLDAATPFSGSVEVRRLFPHSVLLAEPGGTSHADSLFGDRCVDGTIARYLADGTLPPRVAGARYDKTCAPLPVPDPTTQTRAVVPAGASAGLVAFPQAATRPQQTITP